MVIYVVCLTLIQRSSSSSVAPTSHTNSTTTGVSQLFGREPNNKANTSLTRGTSIEVVWLMSPWKEFRCSAMLEPSWYLSLTILLMTETLFRAFFFSNMPPIFFHKTSTSGSSLKLFPKPKHLLWQLCPCHIVLATTGLYTQACLSSSTSKLNSLGRSASTSHQGIHPYSYTCEGTPLALIPVWYGYGLATACKQAEMKAIRNRNYKDRHGVLMWKS